MLAIKPAGVADALISIFSTERELRADELHQRICEQYFKCSSRSVYKELEKLVEQGVAVKIKDRYCLSVSWILNLIKFSEDLYSASVTKKSSISELPRTGERLRWTFHDLRHLDRFWIQLIFQMFESSKSRTMFVWVPFFWFDLIHLQKDIEAQRAMKIAGNKMFLMLGSSTFLDKLPTKYWSRDVYEWSYAKGPFEDQRSTYFDVIDDLILTVRIDLPTTRAIEKLFYSIKSKADLSKTREFEAINNHARATLTLERSPKKSSALRKKCCDFFGIADPNIGDK